jgi:hypothetical protein
MEHVKASLEGLSTKNDFCIGPMVICACGHLLNPAKSQIFNIGDDYALWIRYFLVMIKNPKISILRLDLMAHGHNPAKVQKFKYNHLI